MAETGNALAAAKVFRFDDAVSGKMANGADRRVLAQGTLKTGESVRVHESIQPVGAAMNPLHVIHHSECIVVVEGTVAFVRDGGEEMAKAGDVIYVAEGTNHTLRNAGAGQARYVVVSIGGDVKP